MEFTFIEYVMLGSKYEPEYINYTLLDKLDKIKPYSVQFITDRYLTACLPACLFVACYLHLLIK